LAKQGSKTVQLSENSVTRQLRKPILSESEGATGKNGKSALKQSYQQNLVTDSGTGKRVEEYLTVLLLSMLAPIYVALITICITRLLGYVSFLVGAKSICQHLYLYSV
jgi:hypothetical protein